MVQATTCLIMLRHGSFVYGWIRWMTAHQLDLHDASTEACPLFVII